MGTPGTHLGALGLHLGVQGALGAHLGAHLVALESPLPQQRNKIHLLPALTTHAINPGERVSNTVLIHPFTLMVVGPTGNLIKLV